MLKSQQNGAPQVSVISTTLFNIVINDILKTPQKPIDATLYADDLILWMKGKNISAMVFNNK